MERETGVSNKLKSTIWFIAVKIISVNQIVKDVHTYIITYISEVTWSLSNKQHKIIETELHIYASMNLAIISPVPSHFLKQCC